MPLITAALFFVGGRPKVLGMKTPLTYGFIMTLCSAFVSLALYFTGLQNDPDKLQLAQNIGLITGIIIGVTCILLGMRERRAETPADKPWGYGSALGTGVKIGLFGALFGAVFNYVYFAYINPDIMDVILQGQIAAMEAKNIPAAQIDAAEPFIRKWLSPVVMTITGAIMIFVWNLVISLIVAAFVKNRAAAPAFTVPTTTA